MTYESRTDTTQDAPLVSIVIDNYNYGRFIRDAIESALNQTYTNVEIIVVDDGSTDNSRSIIASYNGRIKPVFKENGGQGSALNAGFMASAGQVVFFLDSDDIMFPHAVKNAATLFRDKEVSKVHWPLQVIDPAGTVSCVTKPAQVPPEGDFRQQVLERGPSNVCSPPTSGNAWSRQFLQLALPIPEDSYYYRFCADEYLYNLAPIFGRIRTIPTPQGYYRLHGGNIYSSRTWNEKLEMEVSGYEEQCLALANTLNRNGITVNLQGWRRHSWFHRLKRAVMTLLEVIPNGSEAVVIDGGTWGLPATFEGRHVRPFLCLDGRDMGPPADSEAAIECLQHLCRDGVHFLVLCWPCYWWQDSYASLFRVLQRDHRRVIDNPDLTIFDLTSR